MAKKKETLVRIKIWRKKKFGERERERKKEGGREKERER